MLVEFFRKRVVFHKAECWGLLCCPGKVKNIGMKKWLICILVFQASLPLLGQQKYWIYLNEKNESVKNSSVAEIQAHMRLHDIETIVVSEWLTAVSAVLPDHMSGELVSLPCIKQIKPLNSSIRLLSLPILDNNGAYDAAIEQIHGQVLLEAGFTGMGVKIGVIDAGFMNAHENRWLKEMVSEGQVESYRNFIETDQTDAYNAPARINDLHGTQVLIHLAGSRNNKEKVLGMAHDATFYLARTDQADKEYRGEEDYWVAALEWMYEQGVRLVNSSLGYSDGYDDPTHNYLPEQSDGKSSVISRVANIAVKEKGMILVLSAGNDGNFPFKVVSIPADAEGVLAVGATNLHWPWTKQGYSSIGPTKLSYVKPDLASYSQSGTSYAAPVITGLIAAVWQARPELTNLQILDWIKSAGHLSGSPNNYLGYGVPDARQLLRRIQDQDPINTEITTIYVEENVVRLDVPHDHVVVYHKRNEWVVSSEEVIRHTSGKLRITRPNSQIHQTTVVVPGKIVEIIWIP